MKFLCDVHIPIRLSKHLAGLGYHSQHVNLILEGYFSKDADIATYCNENDQVLITKDKDFKNSYLISQSPKYLLKLNLGNIPNDALIQLLEKHLSQIAALTKTENAFMIELEPDGSLTVTR